MTQRYLTIILLMLAFTTTLADTSYQQSKQQLTKVNKQINSLKSSLNKDQTQQGKLISQLKQSETQIGTLSRSMKKTSAQINTQKSKLAKLQKQLNQYQTQLLRQQLALKQQIKANYILERQGSLGIYFSGESTDDIQRYLTYYNAMNKAQLDTIDSLQETIQSLSKTANDIKQNTTELQALYLKQKKQQTSTKQQQAKRQKVLGQLNKSIKDSKKQLVELGNNQKSLSSLVKKIAATSSSTSFASMKRKLNWPVKGKLLAFYGKRIASSNINWEGDLIAAPISTNVHAIFGGKVIYADWLRGYGLLIIVDHGDGFMSLYARNHSLNKQVGDSVKTGEVIATVGRTGGFQTPALYLEIRHKGVNLNPELWLRKR